MRYLATNDKWLKEPVHPLGAFLKSPARWTPTRGTAPTVGTPRTRPKGIPCPHCDAAGWIPSVDHGTARRVTRCECRLASTRPNCAELSQTAHRQAPDGLTHSRHAAIGTLLIYADEHDRQGTQRTLADLVARQLESEA